jgi:hypothetical protein
MGCAEKTSKGKGKVNSQEMDYVGKPRATHKKMQQHTNQLD